MKLSAWLALAVRESRGSAGRLVFFAACLSVGVAAIVAVAGLSRALDSGIQGQARQLLAADLAVSSRRPIAQEILDAVDGLQGAERSAIRELPSIVSVPGASSLLCELKAVGEGYPFYGEMETDPARPLGELLTDEQILVAPELLSRLDVAVGDELRLGEGLFRIAGVVSSEPDRMSISFTLGPRVLLSQGALERSQLIGLGSRVTHRLLVRLPPPGLPDDVRAAAADIEAAITEPGFVRVETYAQAHPSLRNVLARAERFLGLIALLSLLVGGIGVAQAIRAWLASRVDAIATLRALGVRPREAFLLYLVQTLFLALCGSGVGAVIGSLAARGVPLVLGDLVPVDVAVGWQPVAMLRGVLLGVGVALLFGLRPLVDVLGVPPVRVMRRDADPLPTSRWLAVLLLIVLLAGVALTATIQSDSPLLGLQFAGGLAVAALLLMLSVGLIVKLVARIPRGLGSLALRHGLAALARPGAGTLGAVVALGLGVLTVLGIYLVQERLAAQFDAELPAEAPTVFMIGIQEEQWPGVEQTLVEASARDIEAVQVVIARLREIEGTAVTELVPEAGSDEDAGRKRWVLTREQRLTTMTPLPQGNEIVAGELWSRDDRDELSIEKDFAEDMGVELGDVLLFDIQGVPLELTVTSLRTVQWERFSINFFLVVEPGVLDGAPSFRVAAAHVPREQERPVQDSIAAAYPGVTLLRVREVLEKVVAILGQVGFGVRVLGGFTVLAGVAILAGAISAGAVRRGREVALYKTLGMTRAQVVTAFTTEYALIGLVAGTIGAAGGTLLAWTVTRYGFEIPWEWTPVSYTLAVLSAVVLTAVAGLAASLRALAVKPLAVLRQAD